MPRRTPDATREYLKNIPLPNYTGGTYTVIEHETVIVNALAQLKLRGFSVEREHYRANNRGDVAIGLYHLNYKNDPELGMMFAWANSYDKTMRFKCAVGGFVRASNGSMIGDDFSWSRKHTGTADQEMIAQVTGQILNGQTYYDNLLLIKEGMKNTMVSKTIMAEFLGRAFINKGLFSKEQIGIMRDEITKSSYNYNCNDDSLWKYYNHMLVALKRTHPRTWMEEHRDIHKLVCTEFMTTTLTMSNVIANLEPVITIPILVEEVVNEIPELPKKKMTGINLEEFAEIKQDSTFQATITNPDEPNLDELEIENINIDEEKTMKKVNPETYSNNDFLIDDISSEEQKLIDERLSMFTVKKENSINLNLPD